MKVSEIMTKAVVSDSADDTLRQAAAKMREQQTGSILVMDDRKLLGIFTERDLLKAIATGQDPDAVRLKDVMTTDVITTAPGATVHEASDLMASRWIRHLPVVDGDKVLGLISQRDLVGVLAQLLHAPDTQGLDEGSLVRSRRIRRIEAGDLD